MTTKQELGAIGEELAVVFLKQKGHIILERNWRSGKDELDIVSNFEGFLVVTEVKTRSSALYMLPEDSVNERKQACIMRAAENYIIDKRIDEELRFDVISVLIRDGKHEIFHIEDAFYSTLE